MLTLTDQQFSTWHTYLPSTPITYERECLLFLGENLPALERPLVVTQSLLWCRCVATVIIMLVLLAMDSYCSTHWRPLLWYQTGQTVASDCGYQSLNCLSAPANTWSKLKPQFLVSMMGCTYWPDLLYQP